MLSDEEKIEKMKLSPRQVLSNKYLYELASRGIITDDQIEVHITEQFKLKGLDL